MVEVREGELRGRRAYLAEGMGRSRHGVDRVEGIVGR
jgi:hypothetical protein